MTWTWILLLTLTTHAAFVEYFLSEEQMDWMACLAECGEDHHLAIMQQADIAGVVATILTDSDAEAIHYSVIEYGTLAPRMILKSGGIFSAEIAADGMQLAFCLCQHDQSVAMGLQGIEIISLSDESCSVSSSAAITHDDAGSRPAC